MLKLLQTFVDIALWRKGPQDLPASRFLAWSVLVAYVGSSFIQVQLFHLRLNAAVAVIAVDVVMLLAWLWLVLAFFGRRQRFVQTVTAVMAVGTIISVLDIVVRAIQLSMGSVEAPPETWGYLRFLAYALIVGRIFMHALERGLFTGIALTIAIFYSTYAVAQLMLTQLQGL